MADWCDIVLFGGAKFGGKSSFLIGDYAQDVEKYNRHWQGILFRQTMPELEDIIRESRRVYLPMGGKFQEQKKTWVFPTGATLKMRYIERLADAERYQGHSYCWVGVDEIGNFPDRSVYEILLGCLRWAEADIPTKRIRLTANPLGRGHYWLKEHFIDPAPLGYVPIDDPITKMTRMYIPSRVTDNKIGLANDPGYIDRLRGVGSPELVKALLEGDWNVHLGGYFNSFGGRNLLPPFEIPKSWQRVRGLDWGFTAPFCCLWVAISSGEQPKSDEMEFPYIPNGALVVYREWYGSGQDISQGLQLTVEEVAKGIKERSGSESYSYSVADPAIFQRQTGPSTAEELAKLGLLFRPGDNKRIPGWMQIQSRIVGQDESPMLFVTSNCRRLIETMPLMVHSQRNPEDLDTNGPDHAVDTLRYVAMSRPWSRAYKAPSPIHETGVTNATFNRVLRGHLKSKKAIRSKRAKERMGW